MSLVISDLALISQKALTAIVRDERLGEQAARKVNNRKLKNRLSCFIYDNKIPGTIAGCPE